MRYVLNIAYDGTDFHGWQKTPNQRTVQQAIETALSRLMKRRTDVTGASRTDSGVHAYDQYAHFDSLKPLPRGMLLEGMNALLPADARVKDVFSAPAAFSARFSSLGKMYLYVISTLPVAMPILNRYSISVRKPLDVAAMKQACRVFVGRHDFSAFRAASCCARSPVKTIDTCSLLCRSHNIYIVVQARSFMQYMVRNLAGAILYAGLGKLRADDISAIMATRDLRQAPPTAPAKGLFLVKMFYPAGRLKKLPLRETQV